MNRRDAIKGLGLSLGYVVATPAVLSLLQSCKNEYPRTPWKPAFFTNDEGLVLENLIDLILPKTDELPGALDLNIPKFLDAYYDQVSENKDKERLKKEFSAVLNELNKSANNLNKKDYDALLSKYLRATPEEVELFKSDKAQSLVYKHLIVLRGRTIWAYKTSEKIGEEVLVYDPIPSVQLGCVPLDDATGGKAWSL